VVVAIVAVPVAFGRRIRVVGQEKESGDLWLVGDEVRKKGNCLGSGLVTERVEKQVGRSEVRWRAFAEIECCGKVGGIEDVVMVVQVHLHVGGSIELEKVWSVTCGG